MVSVPQLSLMLRSCRVSIDLCPRNGPGVACSFTGPHLSILLGWTLAIWEKDKQREKTQVLGPPFSLIRTCTIIENTAQELGNSGFEFDSVAHCWCDLKSFDFFYLQFHENEDNPLSTQSSYCKAQHVVGVQCL